ncbi:RNA 3'-terminal phosphate cyclase [Corynespora cassiicola Philippines]|uniref:RNA 3'-terminal phosphate cyclase n=1 Tax=Corynespora cassiicola Philippines TaxID=1448308 RepID=A0A2T2N162_CORCC|nr:RNA 3'-terminal phosphate cyclase [Corynespora cassiicola Philippines]
MATPIHLEGTTLEGGGQLLRIALGISSLTKTPIHITNIRGGRGGGGGLKAQHLTSVQWLARSAQARASGIGLKSKTLTFTPKTDSNAVKQLDPDVELIQKTPGSTGLILQAILPFLIFSNTQSEYKVRITGGTNVSNSPSFDYVDQVLLPMLERINIPKVTAELHSRGWAMGGTKVGSTTYLVMPLSGKLPAFQVTNRGEIESIQATIIAPGEHEQTFREQLDAVLERRQVEIFGDVAPKIGVRFEDSKHDKRFYLLLVATTSTGVKLGRDWLYDHSMKAVSKEVVMVNLTKKVVGDLVTEINHGGCVDEFMRDQYVIYQALAEGRSSVSGGLKMDKLLEPSLHAQTAQWVVKELMGVEFDEEGSCEGVGLAPTA